MKILFFSNSSFNFETRIQNWRDYLTDALKLAFKILSKTLNTSKLTLDKSNVFF
jgi:hypothetical protein